MVRFSSLIFKRIDESDEVVAWECALSYCVNTYSASVSGGDVKQKIENTWRNNSASHSQGSDLIYNPPQSIINITANASTFKVAGLAANAMNSFMCKTFTGSGGINSSGSAFSSDVIHALYDIKDYSKGIENLATSMTNNVRQQNDSGSSPVEGIAYKVRTFRCLSFQCRNEFESQDVFREDRSFYSQYLSCNSTSCLDGAVLTELCVD